MDSLSSSMSNTVEQSMAIANQVFAFSQVSTVVDVSQLLDEPQKTASVYYVLAATKNASGGTFQAFEGNTYDQSGVTSLTQSVNSVVSQDAENVGGTLFDALYMLNYANVNYTFTERKGDNYLFLVGALLQNLIINTYSTTGIIIQIALDMIQNNSLIQLNSTQVYDANGNALNTGYNTLELLTPTVLSSNNYNINLAQLTHDTIHSLVTPVTPGLNYNFYSGDNANDQNVMSGSGNFFAGLGKDVLKGSGISAGVGVAVSATGLQIATNLYSNLASHNAIQFIVAARDVNVFGNVLRACTVDV